MAYSNTPVLSTYETKDIPAVYDLDIYRSFLGSQPGVNSYGMVNLVPTRYDNEVWAETRYGVNAVTVAAINGYVRGMYVWEKTIGTVYYFVVIHDAGASQTKVYSSTDGITFASVNTLTNDGTTVVRFTEFIDATNTKKLVLVDGIEGYVFTSNAAGTKIADADFPTPHVPFPVFIDGYLFLAKSGTGDIYNSDLNDPAIWTAGNFISSELYPDDLQALVKVQNYLVAIGTQGTEFFYDAANATSSPLARIDSASLAFGTPFPNTIAYTKDTILFLANSNDGAVTLKMIQGTKATDLPCPLNQQLNYLFTVNATFNATNLRGMFFRHRNQLCYGVSLNGMNLGVVISGAYKYVVYCLDEKIWTSFTSSPNFGSDFPVVFTSPTTSNNALTYVAGHNAASPNRPFFGTLAYGNQDKFDGSLSTAISQTITTSIQDFGSLNRKNCHSFGVVCTTSTSGSSGAGFITSIDAANMSLSFYDGTDYENSTSLTGPSGVNFLQFPLFYQLGNFRQRAFALTYNGTEGGTMRFKRFEVKLNRGMN